MTREEYLSYRNNNRLPVSLAFDYYKLWSLDKSLTIEQFSPLFIQFAALYKPDFKDLYHYYDVEFEVVAIVNTLEAGYPAIFQ